MTTPSYCQVLYYLQIQYMPAATWQTQPRTTVSHGDPCVLPVHRNVIGSMVVGHVVAPAPLPFTQLHGTAILFSHPMALTVMTSSMAMAMFFSTDFVRWAFMSDPFELSKELPCFGGSHLRVLDLKAKFRDRDRPRLICKPLDLNAKWSFSNLVMWRKSYSNGFRCAWLHSDGHWIS